MKNKPIFSYSLFKNVCDALQEYLLEFSVMGCQQNDPKRFCFLLRKNEQVERLFFCFFPSLARFHLIYSTPLLRTSSHPLEFYLKGGVVKKIENLQEDRILRLTFQTDSGIRYLIAEFFPKHPNYLLLDANNKILLALHHTPHSHYQPPPMRLHGEIEQPLNPPLKEIETAYQLFEEELFFENEKRRAAQTLTRQIKKLKQKVVDLECKIKECLEWEKVRHEGDLIKAHFASIQKRSSQATVTDWLSEKPYHLSLDPSKTLQEEMAQRFRRAHKLQKGVDPLSNQLSKAQKNLLELINQLGRLDQVLKLKDLEPFKLILTPAPHEKRAPLKTSSTVYREYFSKAGIKIWVGKNAKANDILTFQLANGRDFWLHIQGFSGSHVIIRADKKEPDEETIQDALQLALYHSKAREQKEGEAIITQRKNVAKMTKKKGLVQISHHRKRFVRLDPTRLSRLINSLDASCYDARD